MKTIILTCALTASLGAQWLNHPTPGIPRTADGKPDLTASVPRTADGKPDLTGLWEIRSPESDFAPESLLPRAQALREERLENLGAGDPSLQCLPEGPNGVTGFKRIIQTPALIVILNEDLTYRQIYMDGRELEKDPNPTWMGYSVGHWEGDTLVVESNGFNDRAWIFRSPHTEALRRTESYTRLDYGRLEYKVTLSDPGVFTKPVHITVTARLAADTEMLEYVCAESESKIEHYVGKASDSLRSAVKVAPEILTKYVGVYKGMWGRSPRTVEIFFKDGALAMSLDGRPHLPFIPQSETSFSGSGLAYDFVTENGVVARVIEGHVSGAYPLERQK